MDGGVNYPQFAMVVLLRLAVLPFDLYGVVDFCTGIWYNSENGRFCRLEWNKGEKRRAQCRVL